MSDSSAKMNFAEIVTLKQADSVENFKKKITDTIDFLLKAFAMSDNPSVEFNININVTTIKEQSEINNEAIANELIKTEDNLTNNQTNEDAECENIFREMNEASQWRSTLRSKAVITINGKIRQARKREKRKMQKKHKKQKTLQEAVDLSKRPTKTEIKVNKKFANQNKIATQTVEQRETYAEHDNRSTASGIHVRNIPSLLDRIENCGNRFMELSRSNMWESRMNIHQSFDNGLIQRESSRASHNHSFPNYISQDSRLSNFDGNQSMPYGISPFMARRPQGN